MNDDGLTFPVSKSLAPWFSCCLAEIPEPLRSGIERAFFVRGVSVRRNEFTGQEERAFFDCWDAMDATGRAAWAGRYDSENDPDVSPDERREMQAAFDGVWRLADLQAERERLLAMRPAHPSELRIKREELALIDNAIRALVGTSAKKSTEQVAKRETAPDKNYRLLREILTDLGINPDAVPRDKGGARKANSPKSRALAVALTPRYSNQGVTERTFRAAWERLKLVG